jgi:hypothetical protein
MTGVYGISGDGGKFIYYFCRGVCTSGATLKNRPSWKYNIKMGLKKEKNVNGF